MENLKAGELRLNNWVSDENGYYQIESTHLDEDYFKTLQCWGIPLTEDIILKCGFRIAVDEYVYMLHDTIEITETDYGISFYFMGNFIKSDLKHLHTLQNLYFALTNTELTIKL